MIASSLFLNLLSCRTFLIATTSPVSTTLASKTTPKDPLPIILSAEYDMFCGSKSREASITVIDAAAAASVIICSVGCCVHNGSNFGSSEIGEGGGFSRETFLIDFAIQSYFRMDER